MQIHRAPALRSGLPLIFLGMAGWAVGAASFVVGVANMQSDVGAFDFQHSFVSATALTIAIVDGVASIGTLVAGLVVIFTSEDARATLSRVVASAVLTRGGASIAGGLRF